MRKKIILLALAASAMAAFALPEPAMAVEEDIPLHLVPKPEGIKTIDGEGTATLTVSGGNVVCSSWSGTAEFISTTTGKFEQTFKGCALGSLRCTTSGQPEGTITTTSLESHLVTVEDSVTHATGPGVLITPAAGHYASFNCQLLNLTVGGTG